MEQGLNSAFVMISIFGGVSMMIFADAWAYERRAARRINRRRIARADRARAARLGEARRIHNQVKRDPVMREMGRVK